VDQQAGLPDYQLMCHNFHKMAIEIERKFLLVNDAWKREVIKSEHMRDGLIARFGEGKVRIRLTDGSASLTIKGPREGISRLEFEYEIPRGDAEQMLRTLCLGDPVLEKIRHTVPFGGLDWTIDAYMGSLAGVAFAEVELTHPDQALQLPPWVGEEVTHDPQFRKRALVRRLVPGASQSLDETDHLSGLKEIL
jgi:CYTH domain-containing protein